MLTFLVVALTVLALGYVVRSEDRPSFAGFYAWLKSFVVSAKK